MQFWFLKDDFSKYVKCRNPQFWPKFDISETGIGFLAHILKQGWGTHLEQGATLAKISPQANREQSQQLN